MSVGGRTVMEDSQASALSEGNAFRMSDEPGTPQGDSRNNSARWSDASSIHGSTPVSTTFIESTAVICQC